jgi:hypothetical protein
MDSENHGIDNKSTILTYFRNMLVYGDVGVRRRREIGYGAFAEACRRLTAPQ